MRLDHSGDNIHAFTPPLVRRLEHRVSLADSGGGAEEDLQAAASLPLRLRQKRVGRGAPITVVIIHEPDFTA